MRVLGLDYGDKRIGVAISDEMGWTAQALEVIPRDMQGQHIGRIKEIVGQYNIDTIIVGLPKNMNGTVGERGEICIAFAQTLQEILNIPVQLWDERLTTVSAERTLLEADVSRKKRRQVIDKVAATLILQGYLDFNTIKK